MSKEIKLLGFNFTKINVERFLEIKAPVTLKSDINIKNITAPENKIIKQDIIQTDFVFTLVFENMGNILMEGSFMLGLDEGESKEILKQWKAKTLDEQKKLLILNIIMQKCSLKALQLEEEMGLPYHIQIPKLTTQPKSEEQESESSAKSDPESYSDSKKSKSDYIN
jgi:hypothetical protein